jgi:hypothetical protein
MLISYKFIRLPVKYFLISVLLLPLSVAGQWKYKYSGKFVNGIFVENLIGENLSINYNRNFNIGTYSFFSSSIGLAYNFGVAPSPGEANPFFFKNSGLGIPINVTYNHSIGSLDRAIINMLSRKCFPPKSSLDWFLEAGLGATPSFLSNYKSNNGVFPSAYAGGRIQLYMRRPYKNNDSVIFLRGGIKPHIYKNIFNYDYSASIGFSI